MNATRNKNGRLTCLNCGFTDLRSFFALLRGDDPKCPDCKSSDVTEGEPVLQCSSCLIVTAFPRKHREYSAVKPLACAGCGQTRWRADHNRKI